MSLCRICAHIAVAFLLRIIFGGCRRQKETATTKSRSTAVGGAQFVEKNMNGYRPTRSLVVQTGVSASQTKVFKAHAAPQGLCGNLINAVKQHRLL